MQLTGIHHLTAISAAIRENKRFYTQTLGMRLVKRSVNQDDVSAYHLFYADAVGHPGTDLTFFDWPVPRERRGTRSITRTCLRVHGREALEWWGTWLHQHGVRPGEIVERDGRATLDFEDPEGQRLSLVDDGGAGRSAGAVGSQPGAAGASDSRARTDRHQRPDAQPDGSAAHARAQHARGRASTRLPITPATHVHVFEMGTGGAHAELHVAVQPDLPAAQQGAGGVHHVAFRTPDANYDAWADRAERAGGPQQRQGRPLLVPQSLPARAERRAVRDRDRWSRVRASTRTLATLGEKLVLPPFLEPQRARIAANLKPID